MDRQEIIQKIREKREFSQLPERDVEKAFSHFEKRQASDEEKIKFTRELLHKVFGAFASKKLLSLKNKNEEWILRKHLSTRERMQYYKKIYPKILKAVFSAPPTRPHSPLKEISGRYLKKPTKLEEKTGSIIDLGCGINGFSYKFFSKEVKINYIGVEAVGQLVELANNYFEQNKIFGRVYHESLFELEKIKQIIERTKKPKIIFLFKTLDSLEMLERDYSKKLLNEIAPLADLISVSFATRSMIKRKKFRVERSWIINFIKENFKVLDDFEIGGERYVVFRK